jgi:hypothetical protein
MYKQEPRTNPQECAPHLDDFDPVVPVHGLHLTNEKPLQELVGQVLQRFARVLGIKKDSSLINHIEAYRSTAFSATNMMGTLTLKQGFGSALI